MRKTITAICALVVLAVPGTAQAHVTLQPSEAPAGGFARLDVRVPNERDNASTTKVQVKFPSGFVFASYEPVPGWTAKVAKRKLDKPITSHGNKITEEIDTITWTSTGAKIGPGQFQDFGLSLGIPDQPGKALTFKSIQTYDNGEVVRWINAPDAENEPAPQVTLTAAEDEHGATTQPASVQQDADDEDDTDGAPTWLAVLALVLGALGLGAGLAGMNAARRNR